MNDNNKARTSVVPPEEVRAAQHYFLSDSGEIIPGLVANDPKTIRYTRQMLGRMGWDAFNAYPMLGAWWILLNAKEGEFSIKAPDGVDIGGALTELRNLTRRFPVLLEHFPGARVWASF